MLTERELKWLEELQRRIYEAISEPACDRCQSRTEWHPTDCDKHKCHELYAKETEAVLAIVFEQRVQGFSDAIDRIVTNVRIIANNRMNDSAIRVFAIDTACDIESAKSMLLYQYKNQLEE